MPKYRNWEDSYDDRRGRQWKKKKQRDHVQDSWDEPYEEPKRRRSKKRPERDEDFG